MATAVPHRYLAQLCKHFAHKLPATHAEDHGCIEFGGGVCTLEAGDGTLVLRLAAEDAAARAAEFLVAALAPAMAGAALHAGETAPAAVVRHDDRVLLVALVLGTLGSIPVRSSRKFGSHSSLACSEIALTRIHDKLEWTTSTASAIQ